MKARAESSFIASLRQPCFKFKNNCDEKDILSFMRYHATSWISSPRNLNETEDEKDDINQSNVAVDKDREKVPMNQCITLLEPHIQAFRKKCKDSDIENDVEAIPSPLLRVAKFFAFKWKPIQRALLRSTTKDEVC